MNKHKTKNRIINMFLLFLAGILICSSSFSDEHKNKPISPAPMAPIQQLFMQGNNCNTTFRSDGIFNYDWVTFTTKEAGMIWPVTAPNRRTVNYTSGLWVGAKVNGQIRLGAAAYASHFTPGNIPVIGQVPPQSVCSDPRFRIYYVQLTDPGLVNGGTKTKTAGGRTYTFTFDSWAQWPVDLGAPYVEVNNIQGYQPSFDGDRPGIGKSEARPDEISFMIYQDYTNCTNNIHHAEISLPGNSPPIGAEVMQLSFMFNSPGLTDMYFVKWTIVNKSANTWDSTYVSVFDDADVGDGSCGAADDAVGCDSAKNVGFVYNADNFDCNHGTPPPAIGFKYLQSPIIYTGNPNDSAKLPYDTLIGYRLLGLTGFNYFINGAPDPCLNDPDEFNAGYNFMKGKDGCGRTKINPITNQPTLFSYTGDACGRSGWYDSNSHDVRFMQNSGPFTMQSGDTQVVVIGCFVAKGSDNFQSVCVLLNNAEKVQRIYNLNFRSIPLPPPPQVSVVADGDGKIGLYWLPTAESYNEYDKISLTGYWKFQGYEVYQIKPGTGGANPEDRKLIGVYDIIDSITSVVDSVEVLQPNGQIVVEVIPTAIGTNSGVTRSIVLNQNAFPSGVNNFFINGQDYYFSVVAYGVNLNSWGSRVLKNDIGSQVFRVTPNFPIMGSTYNLKAFDTLQTNRIDRGFLPIVFDPDSIKTARYQMVMRSDTSWNVVRIWNGTVDTLRWLKNNYNLNKINEAATVYDGILFKADSILRENVGVIKDPGRNAQTSGKGWSYSNSTINLAGVDTNSFVNYPTGNFKAMQNLSMGLSWVNHQYTITLAPLKTNTSFKNGFFSRIDTAFIRNYSLKRVKVTFGQTQKAYCYRGEVNNSPYFDYVDIPFKVEIDAPLDTAGPPRQVNVGFYDRDSSGTWNPKATPDGGLEYVYIFYSNYSDQSNVFYQKNISFSTQFRQLDILYVWWPRLLNGGQPAYQNGDILTIIPYTRLKFQQTPGWVTVTEISTTAPDIGNVQLAQQRNELQMVRVVPNPYYGGHSQETSPFDRFVKFMNLPKTVSIYIYTLNGNLVRQLNKDNNETTLNWDLLNTDRIPVASGIYIAYIDAPGIGTKIIKLAIFTPEERLDSF